MKTGKMLIIGLDGATFDIIDSLVREGRLPNIASLIHNGVSALLTSTIPANTSVAWTSMTTGVNPGKHGIFFFTETPHHKAGEGRLLNAFDIRFKRIWTILTEKNKKSIVLGVPFTYPPIEINGIMVCQEKGGGETGDIVTYPPEFRQEIIKRLKIIPSKNIPPSKQKMKQLLTETFCQKFISSTDKLLKMQKDITLFLLKTYDWDFLMEVFKPTDSAAHYFWRFMDANHPSYIPELGPKYKDVIYETYQKIDAIIGEMLTNIDNNTTVIIVSDHGTGPYYKEFYLNSWLVQSGWLKLKKDVKNGPLKIKFLSLEKCFKKANIRFINRVLPIWIKEIKIPVLKRIIPVFSELIDWNNTKAYGTPHGISINLVNREPHGIVQPEDYERLIKEIEENLYKLKDPQTGQEIIKKIYRKEELYKGPFIEESTDLIIIQDDLYVIPVKRLYQGLFKQATSSGGGHHRINGIFIAKGPNIKSGIRLKHNAEIADITPTALYLMGLPILAQMDGKVLKAAINTTFLNENPVVISEEDGYITPTEFKLSAEEEAKTKEQLKALGYLD